MDDVAMIEDPEGLSSSVWAASGLFATSHTVEIISDLEGLERAAPIWEELEARSAPSALFQNHALAMIWARHFLTGPGGPRLLAAIVSTAGQPRLILPLAISSHAGLSIGRLIGAPIAQYSDLLADPRGDLEACFAAAINAVRSAGVDGLLLQGVRRDSQLFRLATHQSRPAINKRIAPFADFSDTPDHQAYLRSRSKNHQHNLRRRRNKLAKSGAVAFEILQGGPQARAALDGAIGLKRDWLIQRGAVSTAFVHPTTTDCLLDLAENCPGALVMRLSVDGKPAAVQFGFLSGQTFFAYLSAYDQELAQFSPSNLLLDFALEALRGRGLRRLDLLAPAGEYKAVWADDSMDVADYSLPLTLKGKMHAYLIQERLRPALQWIWHLLPRMARSLLAKWFLR